MATVGRPPGCCRAVGPCPLGTLTGLLRWGGTATGLACNVTLLALGSTALFLWVLLLLLAVLLMALSTALVLVHLLLSLPTLGSGGTH